MSFFSLFTKITKEQSLAKEQKNHKGFIKVFEVFELERKGFCSCYSQKCNALSDWLTAAVAGRGAKLTNHSP